MKTYEQINNRIESGKAVVLTADEIMDYVDEKGLATAAKEVDVVTTATFGPMCSSGCFLNFGHSKPKIRMSEAWVEDVLVYTGVAAVGQDRVMFRLPIEYERCKSPQKTIKYVGYNLMLKER